MLCDLSCSVQVSFLASVPDLPKFLAENSCLCFLTSQNEHLSPNWLVFCVSNLPSLTNTRAKPESPANSGIAPAFAVAKKRAGFGMRIILEPQIHSRARMLGINGRTMESMILSALAKRLARKESCIPDPEVLRRRHM